MATELGQTAHELVPNFLLTPAQQFEHRLGIVIRLECQFIEAASQRHARNDGFTCAILLSERIVGVVGYRSIHWPNRTTDLGYWLGRGSVGRGLVTRACGALIEHAFVELKLNRVVLCAAVENTRSRAVAERLGFQQEGILRDAEWLYDHFVDHAMYAILAGEWDRKSADSANAAGGTVPE